MPESTLQQHVQVDLDEEELKLIHQMLAPFIFVGDATAIALWNKTMTNPLLFK